MLPILEYKNEIKRLLSRNRVVVICGDTGSGKTTQIPQICLEMGFGARGRRIACTQPRRLAAITVAERVAKELGGEVGGLVGYQHRFARKVSADTRIKFMTDGVLLAETRADRDLQQYDVIILDEAHERNLNMDFLLGILKRLLARRHDLKVIISSATLDTGHFAEFFDNAPTLQVPGRLYPIEMRYQEPEDEEADLPREVGRAVVSLPPEADTLVFLPGERDIRETAEALARIPSLHGDEIIPLLASLPAGEQQKAFRTAGRRRIILATNVAETSVTIPGIRAVVDSGLARLSRYIHRTQVQRLQIERISQASARQRAGRCGRLGPGICIRLYSEEEFRSMEPYTPPEILRSSLSGVILSMLELGLGDIEQFPFLDPPKPTMIREGLRELVELAAIEHREGRVALTEIGRKLARMPVEPRLARMLIAADREAVLPSVLPLVAAMSCDDPRRRPIDEKDKAHAAHAQWRVATSDFLSTLKLWNWWLRETRDQSQSVARKLAQKNYLAFMKMREWREVTRQLKGVCEGFHLNTEQDTGGEEGVHRALLTGLLSKIGRFDPEAHNYRGAQGLRFEIHPGSALAKANRKGQGPDWLMAGELVDTSRLFAREVAGIDPEWLERLGARLCRHHYHSPFWDAESGFVRALEDISLFGLPLVQGRRCDYSRINPVEAREIFIRRGLIDAAIPNPSRPVLENNLVLAEMRRRAEKLRAPELFDEEKLYDFFNAVLPPEICTARDLKKWLYDTGPRNFRLDRAVWVGAVETRASAAFPDCLRLGEVKLRLSYHHSPADPDHDGITCTVPLAEVEALRLWSSDWLVPGFLPEKISYLLSALPKLWRQALVPLEEKVAGLVARLHPDGRSLEEAIRADLAAHDGFRLPKNVWEGVKLPPHLQVRFRVMDEGHEVLVTRDKSAVLALSATAHAALGTGDKAADTAAWRWSDLVHPLVNTNAGWTTTSYPALMDESGQVVLHYYPTHEQADAVQAQGVTRLCVEELKSLRPKLPLRQLGPKAVLYLAELGYTEAALGDDLWYMAVREALVTGQPSVRSEQVFRERLGAFGRQRVKSAWSELWTLVSRILVTAAELADSGIEGIDTQLAWLLYPGFVRLVSPERLKAYPRYLKGAAVRLARHRTNPAGDRAKEARFTPYWENYVELACSKNPKLDRAALAAYRWLLEEYRIQLFAQELGTAVPVSEKRLVEALARVEP